MPVNAGYEYFNAEKKYFLAKTFEEKKAALEEMIRTAPKHKSSEKFVADLKSRLKKLIEKQEKSKKAGKTTKNKIKKEGFQCVLIGMPNSGKSSLLSKITNATPEINSNPYTTKIPVIGTMEYEGVKAQIIDMPSIGSEEFDIGIINTADMLLIVIESFNDIEKINPILTKTKGKKLFIYNKIDLLKENELRKIRATAESRKINVVFSSCINLEGIEEIKKKIFEEMGVIRIYLKEPGKEPSKIPLVLPINSTIKDAAESIRKGLSLNIKEIRITGPSSKFPNQKVGLLHILKDKDIVEFRIH